MMRAQRRFEILLAAAIAAGVPGGPAGAMDEDPQDESYNAGQDATSAPSDLESGPAADAPEALDSEAAPPGSVPAPDAPAAEAEAAPAEPRPAEPESQAGQAPVLLPPESEPSAGEAPVLLPAESGSPAEEASNLLPAESAAPPAEASKVLPAGSPAPEASPLPQPATVEPEPKASPLTGGEPLLAPGAVLPEAGTDGTVVDAPPDAEEAAAGPATPPGETETTEAAEGLSLPVADEAGVLPGLPEDVPETGLEAETEDMKPESTAGPESAEPGSPAAAPVFPEEAAQPAVAESPPPDVQRTLFLLGTEVPPGAIDWLSWAASESFEGISTPTPVLVVNGTSPGPTLCLTAAIHGDELNGVEMVRRVMYSLDPKKLDGAVIGVPIVNLHGFRRSSRYLPDRRDLNRYFPGSPTGSSAARIAYSFFHEIVVHCDQLVDLHTGSFHRANLPQLRADLDNPEVVEMTRGFGATVVLHSEGAAGTLRRAATDAGIPAVTLEAGEPMRLQPKEVAHGVKGIETLLDKLGMVNKVSLWGDPQPVYYDAKWIRANFGGILFSNVNLGERVREGEVLGTVTDPITNRRTEIRSPYDGRIIGRALNQVVMPGFAAFHVGIRAPEGQLHADSGAAGEAAAPDQESPGAIAEPGGAPAAEADAVEAEAEALGYEEEEERPE